MGARALPEARARVGLLVPLSLRGLRVSAPKDRLGLYSELRQSFKTDRPSLGAFGVDVVRESGPKIRVRTVGDDAGLTVVTLGWQERPRQRPKKRLRKASRKSQKRRAR